MLCWQVYLLVAQPSYLVTALFRLHMHFIYGATIAVLLPVVNTRLVRSCQSQLILFVRLQYLILLQCFVAVGSLTVA